jgi:predicted DNA-binding transcriptional regulator AlpA
MTAAKKVASAEASEEVPANQQLLTIPQVAQRLQVSRAQV